MKILGSFQYLAGPLYSLQEAGLLTQDNFTDITQHSKPHNFAYALSDLNKAGILSPENRAVVAKHARLDEFAEKLRDLGKEGRLTQDNFNSLPTLAHASLPTYKPSADFLPKAPASPAPQANSQPSLSLVPAHPIQPYIDYRMYSLTSHIRPSENTEFSLKLMAIFQKNLTPDVQTKEIRNLQTSFKKQSKSFFAQHAQPEGLAATLKYLKAAGILTQTNVNTLIQQKHTWLLTDTVWKGVWSRIPYYLLTQANFERLLVASTAAYHLQKLWQVTNQIINEAPGAARQAQPLEDNAERYQHLIGLQMRGLFNSSQSPLMTRLHEHSLWDNRHASPAEQAVFDKRYGLAIIPSV